MNHKVYKNASGGDVLKFYGEIAPGVLQTIENLKKKISEVPLFSPPQRILEVSEDCLRTLVQLKTAPM